jgi:hypothetical protein
METIHTNTVIAGANQWWNETDFQEMQRITGFRQTDFDPEDRYQAFVDACDTYWNQLNDEEKIEIYNENN